MSKSPTNRNPLESLKQLVATHSDVQVILCPGDLTHQADESALNYIWSELNAFSKETKIPIIVSPGNHDYDWKQRHSINAIGLLSRVTPGYPVIGNVSTKYNILEDGFSLHEAGDFSILNINTMADARKNPDADELVISINEDRLGKIYLAANENRKSKYRIVMLHHHPLAHVGVQYEGDNDRLINGDQLITEFASFGYHFLLHGHKHLPRLKKTDGLNVLACSSFSATGDAHIANNLTNLCHIVNFEDNSKLGRIQSFSFLPMLGWTDQRTSCFPSIIGFGAEIIDVKVMAQNIFNQFKLGSQAIIKIDIINEYAEIIRHLPPTELSRLNTELVDGHGIRLNPIPPSHPLYLESVS